MLASLIVMADTATTDLSSIFGTALSSIQSTCSGYIVQACTYGIPVMGAILAVGIGVKAFKRFAH